MQERLLKRAPLKIEEQETVPGKNIIAVESAVKPVLPPAATPDALST